MTKMKMNDFKEMMHELQIQTNPEESISKIIRNLEKEISFQSIGIILKFANPDLFRIKISRNISQSYINNNVFSKEEFPFDKLTELMVFDNPNDFKLEHNFKQLILIPIKFRDELMGALFVDSDDKIFSEDDKEKLCIFASILSLVVKIFDFEEIIEKYNDIDSLTKLKSLKGLLSQGDYIFTQALRYSEDFVVAVLKFNRLIEFSRQYGMKSCDDVLIKVANILKQELRKTEIVGRIYHDTFVILFPETNRIKAISVISRLDSKLSKLKKVNKLAISWGLKDFSNQVTLKELIDLASEESLDMFRKNKHYNFFEVE